MTTFKNLSPYTIAKNCSDKTDCQDGMDEIKEYLNYMKKLGREPAKSAYIRYYKLSQKIKTLKK